MICVFSSPIDAAASADERLAQMQAVAIAPDALTYEIIRVDDLRLFTEVVMQFDYKTDGLPMRRMYIAHLVWRVDGSEPRLIRHLTIEPAGSREAADVASAFNVLYHSQRRAKIQPVSGQITIIGQVKRVVEVNGICNLYIVDDNDTEWWCRDNAARVAAGDRIKVDGVMARSGRGWCVEVWQVERL